MNNINKTLYIPLYGKALVSKKGIILSDKKAEEIWTQEQFPLPRKSKSKWLAYYMSMRSVVFDKWLTEKLNECPNCIVLHLGCGLDSRIERVKADFEQWYDVDFKAVIDERKRYYQKTDSYHMLSADIKESEFIHGLPKALKAVILLEGVSMYLTNDELKKTLESLNRHFSHLSILVDCYTPFAAKMSKIKNPINDVGVSNVFGLESPTILEENTGVIFLKEHEITPQPLINELRGFEKLIFKFIYAGNMAKKLYKLYEFESEKK